MAKKNLDFERINISIFLNCALLLTAILLNNRAFSVGFLTSLFLLLLLKYNSTPKRVLIFGSITILVIVITLIFYSKTDSSYGRILIYKISLNMFLNNWLYGIGFGKFHLHYLDYQEKYFKAGNYTIKELLLADNTQFAFNDYWQFIIETGIFGICFLVVSIFIVAYVILKAINRIEKSSFLFLLSFMLFASISIAAFFTHVFERSLIPITYVSTLFFIIRFAYSTRKKISLVMTIIYFSMVVFYFWNYKIKTYYDYQKLEKAHDLFQAGYLNESLKNYRQLVDKLNDNPAFLVQYAEVLATSNKNREAEQMMVLALKKDRNNMLYDVLAKIYLKNGKLKEAEDAFLTAIYMVPNRFITRFDLFLFYLNTNQKANALVIGKEILKLPVKIPSLRVNTIISRVSKETKELIKKDKIILTSKS